MRCLFTLPVLSVAVWCSVLASGGIRAESNSPNTDWLQQARYGAFMHFLPSSDEQFKLVDQFDVDALAEQLDAMGVKYFVFTLGQNSGYFNAPNREYEQVTGYAPGTRCSERDLPLDLHQTLDRKGIRLMLYLPCQTPNRDVRAQAAYGLPQGPKDQPIDLVFARKWARVIQEWSDRYGDKVCGWWFDGAYQHVQFNEEIAGLYAAAAKHGNPRSIVTFNPGVKMIHYTEAEDYTAGELNDPFDIVPESRWLDGSQWHALTFVGSTWGRRDVREPTERWVAWARAVVANQGVLTLDMGPNMDPHGGPIGAFAEPQVDQVKAIRAALAQ